MSLGLAPFFRRFELPWGLGEESERKFLNLLRILLAVATLLAILIWLLPTPEKPIPDLKELQERVVQLIVEKPPPPPPPPPKEEPKPEEPKPTETPKPTEKPKPNLRKQMAVFDEFAALREETLDIQDPQMKTPVEDARSERNLISSKAGTASGGINNANMARGFGGGQGAIGTHTTTAVAHGSGLDPNAGGRVQRTGTSGKGSRAREEVEIVFDRNKGALHSIYGRALRDQPELQGSVVLEFTISPAGDITMCRVVSSELKDPELEKKIVARVRQFKFKPGEVEPLTVSKRIDFFPA